MGTALFGLCLILFKGSLLPQATRTSANLLRAMCLGMLRGARSLSGSILVHPNIVMLCVLVVVRALLRNDRKDCDVE